MNNKFDASPNKSDHLQMSGKKEEQSSIRHRNLNYLKNYLEDNLPGNVFQEPVVINSYKLQPYMPTTNMAKIMLITD